MLSVHLTPSPQPLNLSPAPFPPSSSCHMLIEYIRISHECLGWGNKEVEDTLIPLFALLHTTYLFQVTNLYKMQRVPFYLNIALYIQVY